MTQEMVRRMEQPKDAIEQRKLQRKMEKEPRMNKWFGIMPMAISLWIQKRFKK